jgi:alpha-tubulin suppressor-like RCC1 family protein
VLLVAGLTRATAVALGTNYGCALLLDGTIQCWGSNDYGQLGNGSTTDSTTPVPVSGVTGGAAVATDGAHACALRTDGTVVCWGANERGQLGLGTSSGPQTCNAAPCSTTPRTIAGL